MPLPFAIHIKMAILALALFPSGMLGQSNFPPIILTATMAKQIKAATATGKRAEGHEQVPGDNLRPSLHSSSNGRQELEGPRHGKSMLLKRPKEFLPAIQGKEGLGQNHKRWECGELVPPFRHTGSFWSFWQKWMRNGG